MTAEQVTVITDEGNRYPGWVVLSDLVLVRGLRRTDFCRSVRVERDGDVFPVRELADSAPGTPSNRRGVALALAAGTLPVAAGSAAPPGVEATEQDWRDQFAPPAPQTNRVTT